MSKRTKSVESEQSEEENHENLCALCSTFYESQPSNVVAPCPVCEIQILLHSETPPRLQNGSLASPLQVDFLKAIIFGKQHILLNAVPGSGKTTTIVEAARFLPPTANILYLAFNRETKQELSGRLLHLNAGVQTLNSFARSVLHANNVGLIHDSEKMTKLLKSFMYPEQDLVCVTKLILQCVSCCKAAKFTGENWIMIEQVCERIFYESTDDRINLAFVIKTVKGLLEQSVKESQTMDLDDQLYLCAVVPNLQFPPIDYVFVDEAQDLNPVQLGVLQRLVMASPGCRITFVLDPHQAIYGFRGSYGNMMTKISRTFSTIEFPLSVSYRCARSVVKKAQKFNHQIHERNGAPYGWVRNIQSERMLKELAPGDVVLSRTNAAMVMYCLELICHGKRVGILGKDASNYLIKMIKASKSKTIPELEHYLDFFEAKDAKNAKGRSYELDCDLRKALRILTPGKESLDHLIDSIRNLFSNRCSSSNSSDIIMFSSVHQAKGKEWDKVYLLEDTFLNGGEEDNIFYVAITRAKDQLILVNDRNSVTPTPAERVHEILLILLSARNETQFALGGTFLPELCKMLGSMLI